jgi:hypothetical protein
MAAYRHFRFWPQADIGQKLQTPVAKREAEEDWGRYAGKAYQL